MSALRVARAVVNRDLVQCEVVGVVDGEGLDRCVLDVEARDGGSCQRVGCEELFKRVSYSGLSEVGLVLGKRLTLGLVLPPLLPFPSHHAAPLPSMTWPEAPLTVMLLPEMEMRGPAHGV